jgi:hypothetical protein
MREGNPPPIAQVETFHQFDRSWTHSSLLKKPTKNSYSSRSYNFRLDPRFCAKLPPLPDRDEIAGTRKKIKKLAS